VVPGHRPNLLTCRGHSHSVQFTHSAASRRRHGKTYRHHTVHAGLLPLRHNGFHPWRQFRWKRSRKYRLFRLPLRHHRSRHPRSLLQLEHISTSKTSTRHHSNSSRHLLCAGIIAWIRQLLSYRRIFYRTIVGSCRYEGSSEDSC